MQVTVNLTYCQKNNFLTIIVQGKIQTNVLSDISSLFWTAQELQCILVDNTITVGYHHFFMFNFKLYVFLFLSMWQDAE